MANKIESNINYNNYKIHYYTPLDDVKKDGRKNIELIETMKKQIENIYKELFPEDFI